MFDVIRTFWEEEAGFIVSAELALVSTIGVMGMVAGLAEVSNNVNGELHDVGQAFSHIDQSYAFQLSGGSGSQFQDADGHGTPVDIGL
ncbi:MAG: branched-chain amino acid aminotransferase [Planctomycetaceae bacterium]|nr:branched-chain amino acid aminotransferase [Planctomycetaceae bacterium]